MADANRDMMGSKADMISAKFDEVSRNAIWREHVHKEDARPRDHAPRLKKASHVPNLKK